MAMFNSRVGPISLGRQGRREAKREQPYVWLSVIADKLRPRKKNEEARMGTVPLVSLRYCTRKPATYSKPAASLNAKVPTIPGWVRVSTLAEMSPLPLLVAVPTSLQLL